jgi:flagellar biosynthesis protein FlhF
MQANIYRGRSIGEVTARIKNALGPDAMILSSKKLEGEEGVFEIAALPSRHSAREINPNPLNQLRSELITLKEMIHLSNLSESSMERLLATPILLQLYARLIRNGVKDRYARVFLERGGAFDVASGSEAMSAKKKTLREIALAIEVDDPFEAGKEGRTVAALIGTTGVGKTTTAAKLAARLMLRSKKKVGLISIDGYRIGAMEQLRTYADILGIPYSPAFCRKDLALALKRMEDRNVVLIDTAGLSHNDTPKMEALRGILGGNVKVTCHLLLQAATQESEMLKIGERFRELNYASYIFTKMDESGKAGTLFNQVMSFKRPISYVTTGQNVPDDIEKGDRMKFLGWMLNKN